MRKNLLLLVLAFALIGVGLNVWYFIDLAQKNSRPAACTMEAKICPDGSAVGRSGPNCSFAACPGEAAATTMLEVGLLERGELGNIVILPNEVVEDSRCPMDVVCIWAGRVRVATMVQVGSYAEQTVLTLGETHLFQGVNVTLEKVLPEKKSTEEIKKYRFEFAVQKK